MKEPIKLVLEGWEGIFRFRELCERYGISPTTGYKWLKRWEEEGLAGLKDRPRFYLAPRPPIT